MLVLTRKTREQIQIGDQVVITILRVKGQSVRVGIEAPRDVRVLRSELPKHESLPEEANNTQDSSDSKPATPTMATKRSHRPTSVSKALKSEKAAVGNKAFNPPQTAAPNRNTRWENSTRVGRSPLQSKLGARATSAKSAAMESLNASCVVQLPFEPAAAALG